MAIAFDLVKAAILVHDEDLASYPHVLQVEPWYRLLRRANHRGAGRGRQGRSQGAPGDAARSRCSSRTARQGPCRCAASDGARTAGPPPLAQAGSERDYPWPALSSAWLPAWVWSICRRRSKGSPTPSPQPKRALWSGQGFMRNRDASLIFDD